MLKVLVHKALIATLVLGIACLGGTAQAQNSPSKPLVINQTGGSQSSAGITFVGRGSGAVTILDDKAGNRITYGQTIKVVKSRAPKPVGQDKAPPAPKPKVGEPMSETPTPVVVSEAQPEPKPAPANPTESIRDMLRQRAERMRATEPAESEPTPPPRRTKRNVRASS